MTNTKNAQIALKISDISIRQDQDGRYCLNDLHKASGNQKRHQPSNWLATQQAKELIEEILTPGITGIKTAPVNKFAGRYGATYVVKELVYAYCMWVSAKFHIIVIRAYDALQSEPKQPTVIGGSGRILMTIENGQIISSTAINSGCVIDPTNIVSLKTMINEYVPAELMADVIDIANKKAFRYINYIKANFPVKA